MSNQNAVETKTDVVLVGAGIMSATLGALLRQLQPDWSISTFERLDAVAAESSDPGTTREPVTQLCELNYTPENSDGTVDIKKAVNVNEQFQVSRQFWAHAVEQGVLTQPKEFINPIAHVSFVHGEANAKYLRARYDALAGHTLFRGMEYIDDPAEFSKRLPLMAKGRDFSDPIALNWSQDGTDVDFGALTKQLIGYIGKTGGKMYFGHEVTNLTQNSDKSWTVKVTNRRTGEKRTVRSRFVFVGAGGGALHLLQKSGIKEAKGFGGFPVSGAFLRCTNPNSSTSTAPRSTARLPSAPRPCRCLTWTPVSSATSRVCCSVPTLVGRRSSSSRVASRTCPARSSRTTSSRCSVSVSASSAWSSTCQRACQERSRSHLGSA